MFWKKKPTNENDRLLADNLRKAIDQYNEAAVAVQKSGLSFGIIEKSFTTQYLHGYPLELSWIYRNERHKC